MKKDSLFCDYAYFANEDRMRIARLDDYPARLLFEDLGFLRAWAVFERLEAKKNTLFHPEDHFLRLVFSMKETGLNPPESIEKFKPDFQEFLSFACSEVLKRNGPLKKSLMTIFVTGGRTPDGFNSSGSSSVFILNSEFKEPILTAAGGLKLKTILHKRELTCVKTTNYLIAEAGGLKARQMGYDDLLYFYNGGNVLECTKSNFFIAEGRVIKTPRYGVLEGVTRKIVLSIARKRGYSVLEQDMKIDEVYLADEAFVTSSARGVWPVSKVDAREFAIGPATIALRKAFAEYREKYYEARS